MNEPLSDEQVAFVIENHARVVVDGRVCCAECYDGTSTWPCQRYLLAVEVRDSRAKLAEDARAAHRVEAALGPRRPMQCELLTPSVVAVTGRREFCQLSRWHDGRHRWEGSDGAWQEWEAEDKTRPGVRR